jgi:hypothetical protein
VDAVTALLAPPWEPHPKGLQGSNGGTRGALEVVVGPEQTGGGAAAPDPVPTRRRGLGPLTVLVVMAMLATLGPFDPVEPGVPVAAQGAEADPDPDPGPDLTWADAVPLDAPIRFRGGQAAPFGPDTAPTTANTRWMVVSGGPTDLNGNGIVDYVAGVSNSGGAHSSWIGVWLGNGDGTFGLPTYTPLEGSAYGHQPWPVATGDLTGDGHVDVVSAGPRNSTELRVFPGDGEGGLDPDYIPVPLPAVPSGIVLADLGGTGDLDVIVPHYAGNAVSVVRNLGSGVFAPFQQVLVGSSPVVAAVVELAGGEQAIAVGHDSNADVWLLREDGEGGWVTTADPLVETARNLTQVTRLWAADFTGNGHTDLAVAARGCPRGGCFVVLDGDGTGTFTTPPFVADGAGVDTTGRWLDVSITTLSPAWWTISAPAPPVDTTGNGHLDLVFSMEGCCNPNVYVMHGQGGGLFERTVVVPGAGSPPEATVSPNLLGINDNDARVPDAVAWADVNGNGLADIVMSLGTRNRAKDGGPVTLFADPGAPTGFDAAHHPPIRVNPQIGTSINSPHNAALGDWSGDGIPDLVFRTATRELAYLPGLGNGDFGPVVVVDRVDDTVPCNYTEPPREVRLLDVDGDGNLDLVWDAYHNRGICIVHGDGAGGIKAVDINPDPDVQTWRNGFGVPTPDLSVTGIQRDHQAWGDVEGNGRPGMIAWHNEGGESVVRWFRNLGTTGQWTVEELFRVPDSSRVMLETADVDGDGHLDLVVVRPSADRIDVHLNDGDGNLAVDPVVTEMPISSGKAIAIATGDLDGDGRDDLVITFTYVSTNWSTYMQVLLAEDDATFGDPVQMDASTGLHTQLVDLDGDGKLDIVHASHGFGLEVFLGTGDRDDIEAGEGFGGPWRFSAGSDRAHSPMFADLDGDGRLDVVLQIASGPAIPYSGLTVLLQTDPLEGSGPGIPASRPALVASEVSGPASVTAGHDTTISWTVSNEGTGPAQGTWVDSVWLSLDDTWDIGDRLLGEVVRTGPLAPGDSYQAELTAPALPLAHGEHRIIVRTDARRQVLQLTRDGNLAVGAAPVDVDVPLLTDVAPLEVDLAPGEVRYARIPAAAGQQLRFGLSGPADAADVALTRDRVPVPRRDVVLPDVGETSRRVALPAGEEPGTWYVRLDGRAGLGAGATVVLTVEDLVFGLLDVSPKVVGNDGRVTLTLNGAGFTADTVATVIGAGDGAGTSVTAEDVIASADGRRLFATFAWGPSTGDGAPQLPPGDHHVRVQAGGDEDRLDGALRLIEVSPDIPETINLWGTERFNPCSIVLEPQGDLERGQCPVFDVYVNSPASMRALSGGLGVQGTVTWRNRAFVDIPRPFMDLRGRGVQILLEGSDQHVFLQEVPIELDGVRPDILPAGAVGTTRFWVRPTSGTPIDDPEDDVEAPEDDPPLAADFDVSVGVVAPFNLASVNLRHQVEAIAVDPEVSGQLSHQVSTEIQRTFVGLLGGTFVSYLEALYDGIFSSANEYYLRVMRHQGSMSVPQDAYVRALNDTALELFRAGIEVEASRSVREAWVEHKAYATAPMAPLQGMVTADGDPVVMPEVRTVREEDGRTQLGFSWVDGRYSIYARSGVHDVVVDGLLPRPAATVERDGFVVDPEVLDLALSRGAILAGAVTAGGLPRDDATITVHTEAGPTEITTTGPGGAYELSGLEPGTHEVVVEAPEARPFRTEVTVTTGPVPLDVDLAEGGVLEGTVTGPGGPIAGATVTASPVELAGSGDRVATTGPGGTFRIVGLDDGDWELLVSAAGHGDHLELLEDLTEAASPHVVPVVLAPEAVIEATVVDSLTGEPIPEPLVQVTRYEGRRVEVATGADDGTVRIERLPAGEVPLRVSAGGVASTTVVEVVVPGGTLQREYALAPPVDVSARIVDEAGAPLVGVGVELLPESEDVGERLETSGPDGTVVFDGVPAGTHQLIVGGAVTVTIGPSGPAGDVVVPTSRVRGVVTSGGIPLPEQLVHLVDGDGRVLDRAVTDPDGRYELFVLVDGTFTVLLAASGVGVAHAPVPVTVPTDVEVDLATGTGTVQVTLAEATAPSAVVRLRTGLTDDPDADLLAPVVIDPEETDAEVDSVATLGGLQPGTYTIEVSQWGWSTDRTTVTVAAGATEVVEATLVPATLVSGTITSAGDAPEEPRTTEVVFVDADTGAEHATLSFTDREAYETPVPPGTYDVLARNDAGTVLLTDVEITGEEATLDLSLSPGATLGVTIAGAIPGLMAEAAVVVRLAASGVVVDAATAIDATEVEVPNLPPGTYRVELDVDGRPLTSTTVEIGDEPAAADLPTPAPAALARLEQTPVDDDAGIEAVGSIAAVAASAGPDDELLLDAMHTAAVESAAATLASLGIDQAGIDAFFAAHGSSLLDWIPNPIDGVGALGDRFINTLFLEIPEPERDEGYEALRESLREALEHAKRSSGPRRLSECATLIRSVEATGEILDARKEALFGVWESEYAGSFYDVSIPVLELVKMIGAIAGIIIVVAKVAVFLGASSAALTASTFWTGALGTAGTVGFVVELLQSWMYALYDAFASGRAQEALRSFASFAESVIELLLHDVRARLGGEDGVLITSATLGQFADQLKGRITGVLEELTDAQKVADATGKDIEIARAEMNAINRETRLLRAQRQAAVDGLVAARSRGDAKAAQVLSDRISSLEVDLSRLDSRARPLQPRMQRLRVENSSALAKIRRLAGDADARRLVGRLTDAAGFVGEIFSLVGSYSAFNEEMERGAVRLAERVDNVEKARDAYLAAEVELNLNIRRTTRTVRDPSCRKPPQPPITPRTPNPGSFARSSDPNEVVGPAGAGDARFLAGAPQGLGYTIHFENLGPGSEVIPPGVPMAEVAAALVTITTELDPDVDLASFELGDVVVGEHLIEVPAGLQVLDLLHGPIEDPAGEGGEIYVMVEASVDPASRVVTWVLTAIDPETGMLVSDFRGLLPPEDGSGDGMGFVTYRVDARPDAPTGTEITAQADIVFDDNDSILTNVWSNTLDDDLPTSSIAMAPTTTTAAPFSLAWESSDPTSAAVRFDLLVRIEDPDSDDEGEMVPIKRGLVGSGTTITYEDLRFGLDIPEDLELELDDETVTYGFAVVATDMVGHRELLPLGPEATVTVRFTEAALDPGDPGDPGEPGGPGGPGGGGGGGDPDDPAPRDPDPLAPPAGYPDVDAASVHAWAIDVVTWWEIARGYPDGTYRPAESVTRDQMASFIARLILHTGGSLPPPTAPFTDVDGPHAGAIGALAAAGIVEGYGDGRFGPRDPVTRAQMAAFIDRALTHLLGEPLPDGPGRFPDVAGNVHADAIARLAAAGIVTGFPDGTYGPDQLVTRAQMASFLARALQLLQHAGTAPLTPPA